MFHLCFSLFWCAPQDKLYVLNQTGICQPSTCNFQAWISNGKSTSEISADVQTWWKEYGENFIKKRGSGSQDNTDDPQEDSGLVDVSTHVWSPGCFMCFFYG